MQDKTNPNCHGYDETLEGSVPSTGPRHIQLNEQGQQSALLPLLRGRSRDGWRSGAEVSYPLTASPSELCGKKLESLSHPCARAEGAIHM